MSERSLSGTALNCTVTLGLGPPRVGLIAKALERILFWKALQPEKEKLNGKWRMYDIIKVTVTLRGMLWAVKDYCFMLAYS